MSTVTSAHIRSLEKKARKRIEAIKALECREHVAWLKRLSVEELREFVERIGTRFAEIGIPLPALPDGDPLSLEEGEVYKSALLQWSDKVELQGYGAKADAIIREAESAYKAEGHHANAN